MKRNTALRRKKRIVTKKRSVRYNKTVLFDRPFLSLEKQVDRLESRGLIFDNLYTQKEILKRSNYYCLVNGYKSSFLDKTASVEKYEDGTTFNNLLSLFELDREMRTLFLQYLLYYEEELKALISYHFSQYYDEIDGYLDIKSYDKTKKENAYKIIKELSGEIYYQCTNSKSRNYIKHYYEKHSYVPLWVLINSPTFGKISKLYECLPYSVRNSIAADFSKRFKIERTQSINFDNSYQLEDKNIMQFNKIINLFRNVCAHSEVLYLYTLIKPIKSIDKYFFNLNQQEIGQENIFTLVCVMGLILPKEKYDIFISQLEALFFKYDKSISSTKLDFIISNEMKFPSGWASKLK